MIYRKLGKTDIEVSAITVGTAAWGNEMYAGKNRTQAGAVPIIKACEEAGINSFDIATNYGQMVPGLVSADSMVFYKVRFLDYTDVPLKTVCHLMVHNASCGDICRLADNFYRSISGRRLGVSVYAPEETLTAITNGIAWVQFPYNLLDTRHEFAFGKIGTMARSPLLRGKLASVAEEALRFSFFSGADTTVLGINSTQELDFALECLEKGPIDYEEVIDPRRWK